MCRRLFFLIKRKSTSSYSWQTWPFPLSSSFSVFLHLCFICLFDIAPSPSSPPLPLPLSFVTAIRVSVSTQRRRGTSRYLCAIQSHSERASFSSWVSSCGAPVCIAESADRCFTNKLPQFVRVGRSTPPKYIHHGIMWWRKSQGLTKQY